MNRKLLLLALIPLFALLTYTCDTTDSTNFYILSTTITPEEGGSVSPEGGEFEEGAQVEISSEASEGWRFVEWQGDLNGSDPSASVILDSDKNITAVFVRREYPLNLEIEGEGSVTEEVVEAAEKGEFEHGTTVRLTAEADDGWRFAEWRGDTGETGDEETLTDAEITVTVEEERNITAVFVRREYPLNIEIEGEGSVTEEVVEEAAKGDFEHGTTVRLTAEADDGWRFMEWRGDTGEVDEEALTDGEITVTVEEERNITAVFEQEFTVNLNTVGSGVIRTEPENGPFLYEDDVTLTAEGDEGWRFDVWEGDLTGVDNPATIESIDGDKEVTGVFVPIVHPLWAMGYNNNGQLGDGSNTDQATPVQGGRGFFDVDYITGGTWHTLLVKLDGTLLGMGYNKGGQLGDGTTTDYNTPVEIDSDVVTASAGEYHSLYLKSGGVLMGMGRNTSGQLADGDTSAVFLNPIQIETGVSAVAAGLRHTLYIKTDGTLWTVGSNEGGQLGDGTTDFRTEPYQLDTDVEQIAAGGDHSLYVKTDGSLWAVGSNLDGQLGDGTNTQRLTPVRIAEDVDQVAAGRHHSMFTKTDGTLWMTGNNANGQLGTGDTSDVNTPAQIDTDVSRIAGGIRFSLYLKTDGSLYTMGENSRGQLGDGTTDDRSEPMQVASDVIRIAAGARHALYIKD
ncbi:MAG: hypothetical protein WD317_06340 [Balneolaceae bacterium]